MRAKLSYWLQFESTVYLQLFFIFMTLALFGRQYFTFPYIALWFWLVYSFWCTRQRAILLTAIRRTKWLWLIGGLVLSYGAVIVASTVVNQGRADAWDGWERISHWLFCALVGFRLSIAHQPEMIYRLFSRWQAMMLSVLALIIVGSAAGLFPYPKLGVLDFKTKVDTIFEMLCLATYVNLFAPDLKQRERLGMGFALLLGIIGFCVAGTSRMMLPVMAGGVVLAAWIGRQKSMLIMPPLLAGALLLLVIASPEFFLKLQTIELANPVYWREKILNYRDVVWYLSLMTFAAYPWLGVGPGNIAPALENTRQSLQFIDPSNQSYLHTHNIWWNPFVACGILAGILHSLLMIYIIGFISRQLAKNETRLLAVNLLMIWYVYQFYGMVELAPAMEEIVPYVWGATGLLLGQGNDEAST